MERDTRKLSSNAISIKILMLRYYIDSSTQSMHFVGEVGQIEESLGAIALYVHIHRAWCDLFFKLQGWCVRYTTMTFLSVYWQVFVYNGSRFSSIWNTTHFVVRFHAPFIYIYIYQKYICYSSFLIIQNCQPFITSALKLYIWDEGGELDFLKDIQRVF